jgi:hypothetical protein
MFRFEEIARHFQNNPRVIHYLWYCMRSLLAVEVGLPATWNTLSNQLGILKYVLTRMYVQRLLDVHTASF